MKLQEVRRWAGLLAGEVEDVSHILRGRREDEEAGKSRTGHARRIQCIRKEQRPLPSPPDERQLNSRARISYIGPLPVQRDSRQRCAGGRDSALRRLETKR